MRCKQGSSKFLPHLNELHAAKQQIAAHNSDGDKGESWNPWALDPKQCGLHKLFVSVHSRLGWLIPNANLNTCLCCVWRHGSLRDCVGQLSRAVQLRNGLAFAEQVNGTLCAFRRIHPHLTTPAFAAGDEVLAQTDCSVFRRA